MGAQPNRHRNGNADYSWDDFDSTEYFEHNYSELRPDDAQILEAVRDFFCKVDCSGGAGGGLGGRPTRGLDVGSGSNLYPALAMLPFCAGGLTLWEYSARNIDWLCREVGSYSKSWDLFWERLAVSPPYQGIADPRAALAERARVHQGSIFDLPTASWDVGTMFFVSESLTEDEIEFSRATRCFVAALRPGAPFAAAFMENSTGYDVGDRRFPAVEVTVESVRHCLEGVSGSLDISRVDIGGDPLRAGYTGMILALGTVALVDPE